MLPVLSKPKPLAIALIAALSLVLLLVAIDLGGRVPPRPDYEPRAGLETQLGPIHQIPELFAPQTMLALTGVTNHNPFFTTHFQPPPPPKPPATRKIELTYHGFYRTAEGKKMAFVKLGDKLTLAEPGTQLEGQLTIGEITHESITLKDVAGKPHVIKFNTKEAIELQTK